MNFWRRSRRPAAIVARVATISIRSRCGSRVSRSRSAGHRPDGSTDRSPTVTMTCRSGRAGASSRSFERSVCSSTASARVAPGLVSAKRCRQKSRLTKQALRTTVGVRVTLEIVCEQPLELVDRRIRGVEDRRTERASRRAALLATETARRRQTRRRPGRQRSEAPRARDRSSGAAATEAASASRRTTRDRVRISGRHTARSGDACRSWWFSSVRRN